MSLCDYPVLWGVGTACKRLAAGRQRAGRRLRLGDPKPALARFRRGLTETRTYTYGGPGAVSFGYQCDLGSIRDVEIAEAFAPAIEVNYSTNVWLQNVRIVRTARKRGGPPYYDQGYLVSWDSTSTGGGATNLSIDSSTLALGVGVKFAIVTENSRASARETPFSSSAA